MSPAERWRRWWLAPEAAINIDVARVLLALTALWVVLSRFDLPSVLSFPPELWETVPFDRRARFLLVFPIGVERVLWIALHLSLIVTIAGAWKRWSCIVSGLLLYHFAPLETVIWTPNPYLRGLTIPCLCLLILGFAERDDRPGWGLRLTQFLMCALYFFAGYSKLFSSGLGWADAHHIRLYLLGLDQFVGMHTDAARALAGHPALCRFIGVFGIVFELAFPLVLFSRRLRWVFIPLAVVFHIANSLVFHIFFHDLALLLVFVDWQWLRAALRSRASSWVTSSA